MTRGLINRCILNSLGTFTYGDCPREFDPSGYDFGVDRPIWGQPNVDSALKPVARHLTSRHTRYSWYPPEDITTNHRLAGHRARDPLPCGEGGRNRSVGAAGRGNGAHPITIEVSLDTSVGDWGHPITIEVSLDTSVGNWGHPITIEVSLDTQVATRCPFRFALENSAQHLPHGEGDIRWL